MVNYTANLWQESINGEYQADGFPSGPKVSLTKLLFPPNTSRIVETTTMSLFYPNNIMNAFLYRLDNSRFVSPLCACEAGEQDGWHILTECPLGDTAKQTQIKQMIEAADHHGAEFEVSHLLVSWIRTPTLLSLATQLTEEAMWFLRTEITL